MWSLNSGEVVKYDAEAGMSRAGSPIAFFEKLMGGAAVTSKPVAGMSVSGRSISLGVDLDVDSVLKGRDARKELCKGVALV